MITGGFLIQLLIERRKLFQNISNCWKLQKFGIAKMLGVIDFFGQLFQKIKTTMLDLRHYSDGYEMRCTHFGNVRCTKFL